MNMLPNVVQTRVVCGRCGGDGGVRGGCIRCDGSGWETVTERIEFKRLPRKSEVDTLCDLLLSQPDRTAFTVGTFQLGEIGRVVRVAYLPRYFWDELSVVVRKKLNTRLALYDVVLSFRPLTAVNGCQEPNDSIGWVTHDVTPMRILESCEQSPFKVRADFGNLRARIGFDYQGSMDVPATLKRISGYRWFEGFRHNRKLARATVMVDASTLSVDINGIRFNRLPRQSFEYVIGIAINEIGIAFDIST